MIKGTMVGLGEATNWRHIKEPFILQDDNWWPNRLQFSVEEAEALRDWLDVQLKSPKCRRPITITV